MAEPSNHKRSPDDLLGPSNVKKALIHLKEELNMLELELTNKPNVDFSNVTEIHLYRAGVRAKTLEFEPEKVNGAIRGQTPAIEAEVADLHCVNMDYGTGSLMVLDAVLLSLAAIASSQQREIVIFPEIRFAGYDKVQVSHPVTGYELSLRGSVDYTIIEIDNVDNRKARLLRPEGSQVLFLKHRNAQVLFLLVKAKYRDPEQTFASHIPEAVGQAITLMKYMNITEARFCLSDGLNWRFYILKSEDGMLTYYGSALYCLSKDSLQESEQSLREIMQLICEWVWPTTPDLFVLAKSAGRV